MEATRKNKRKATPRKRSSTPKRASLDVVGNIRAALLPYLERAFADFEPGNLLKPTAHLFEKLNAKNPFRRVENEYNKSFLVGDFPDCSVILRVNPRCFHLFLAPPGHRENDDAFTNISLSPSATMYVYGVKSGKVGPKINGNDLNKLMMDVSSRMRIPQVYISDGAGIPCFYDESIELKHFSIMRVIVGKPTFYSALAGDFKDPPAAAAEIKTLRARISEEKKEIIKNYLAAITQKQKNNPGICDEINDIITEALALLPPQPAILSFVATP